MAHTRSEALVPVLIDVLLEAVYFAVGVARERAIDSGREGEREKGGGRIR
jgi:hypothetical protein